MTKDKDPVSYFEDEDGLVRYRVKGGNGEIMTSSEGYVSESNAERGVQDLKDALENWKPSALDD